MGLLRRSRDAPAAAGPGPADAAVADDGADAEEDVPVGPTGRPLHPVGAYFEAAFRRFGINFLGYLVITAVCGLPWLVAELSLDRSAAPPQVQLLVRGLFEALGLVAVTAVATILVSGGVRARMASVLVACGVTGAIGGVVIWNFSHFALLPLLPFLLFPPIAAVSGDAGGLRAVWAGAVATVRWFRRAYACVFGLMLVAIALWIGFTAVAFIVTGPLGDHLRIALTMLFLWPVSALVFRNLYGDMTGRLVIQEAPGENQRRRDALKAKRARGKRNRKRLERVAEDD